MIDENERMLYEWQYGFLNSFHKELFNIISKADSKNTALLKKAYPEIVTVIKRFKEENGYWEDVKYRMKLFQLTDYNTPTVTELKVLK